MGKKLIIKGADFSENGILVQRVVLDKSELYNNSNVQVTAQNIGSQTKSDKRYYFTQYYNAVVTAGSNININFFSNKFEVGDYQKLNVKFIAMPGITVGSTKYAFGIGFANINDRIIKVYGPTTSEASGDWYIKVSADFSGEIDIPEGTKYVYIVDTVTADNIANHKVELVKYIEE